MRVLNLYAGIGGNRKLWTDVEVTAVELNPQIAKIYQDFFPQDKVIVADAHQYLLEHFKEYDFIWSSPPCPTHSITRFMQEKKVYPDMQLYQEIILLKQWGTGKWLIENVVPYYEYLIKPTAVLHRHSLWSNFVITNKEYPKMETCKKPKEREFLQKELGFNLDRYEGVDKRKLLRNCVLPELGLHILNESKREVYGDLFNTTKPVEE
jgi:DNA (cytosine-5)-methyltransferase 1